VLELGASRRACAAAHQALIALRALELRHERGVTIAAERMGLGKPIGRDLRPMDQNDRARHLKLERRRAASAIPRAQRTQIVDNAGPCQNRLLEEWPSTSIP